ncbi:MAG TPA: GNAT family protein [Thermotogota bacterium]|jgi:UDP-4-amino-4,6-dideoxy-N-acetyl-beta-L-altrosamine N-acetyltransferase|nr:GNAT family N-acetyltransferase [Thermotogota bacterium]NLZ13828.1 GNAT family N-acetyltransferase [Thermotogaceae bacterium]MDD8041024.1 GNAT family protein [Thermotogota bacterium]MDD8052554.1 GNAT family protein [Thermotogota bacterium]HNR63289.1 GNAT family protein [Thermotogota bacterium]
MFYGKRLFLRPYEKGDAKIVLAYRNDPEIMKFLIPGIPYPLSVLEEERWIEDQARETERKSFAIILKETGEYIGGCGFNEINWKARVATIGIFLGQPFWNKGLGTEAFQILIDFAFTELNMNKLKLFVFSFNKRAMRSYEKNGFKVEGVLRQEIFRDGQYHDEIVMGLLVSEWKARRLVEAPRSV